MALAEWETKAIPTTNSPRALSPRAGEDAAAPIGRVFFF
jgi:hypothetical protein